MRCIFVPEFDVGEADQPARRVELMRLDHDTVRPISGDVGMAIEEAKTSLLAVQREVVIEQPAQFCQRHRACPRCQAPRQLTTVHCSEGKTVFAACPTAVIAGRLVRAVRTDRATFRR